MNYRSISKRIRIRRRLRSILSRSRIGFRKSRMNFLFFHEF